MSFRAYASDGCAVTKETAYEAATEFFKTFPTKRKCNVIEGKVEGTFFIVKYGKSSTGDGPKSYKDVTKKTAEQLK